MKKITVVVGILVLLMSGTSVFAESEGEKLFSTNHPEESIPVLEEEIKSGNNSPNAWNCLGLAYFQTGDYKKSAQVFADGLKASGTNKKILAFNQGNSYYLDGDYEQAVKSFSLTLTADASYTKALLNRANSYLMMKSYDYAVEDYELYLELEPEDPQYENIEALLELLRKEIVRLEEEAAFQAAEAARIAAEEERLREEMEKQRIEEEKRLEAERIEREKREEAERLERERKEEEERIQREKEEAERKAAEAAKRAADAERRRKLLEEVANSLQSTDSTNMSSGAEQLMDYDYESELD